MYRIILFLVFFTGCSVVDSQDAISAIGSWRFTEQRVSGSITLTTEIQMELNTNGRYVFIETQSGNPILESRGTFRLGSLPPRQVITFFNDPANEVVPQVYFFVDDSIDALVTSIHPNFTLSRTWTRR
ncbi:MAG: hypothetical protein ACRC9L_08875 [Brevinema sp.]